MQAFVPVPGGHAARVDPAERRILRRLVTDVAELLGTRLEEAPDPRAAEADGDAAVLAALDFTPGQAGPDVPADPAVARLLPPMSQDDPELAAELRTLTEQGLRAGKVARLATVREALREGAGDVVLVRTGQEQDWLAALTDVRLVLAVRLGIEDEADAEAVQARAEAGHPARRRPGPGRDPGRDPDPGPEDEVTDALATMYTALTWWQESLLEALHRRNRRR
ncbi:DUF2017 domain-containing protein [Georgenia sp. TF02-10]|uniref:DUF2017 domain-containing protein n=1 Tax=Georgenia sp. TF02-10 TaxID=2917725 RepID=UPI001FA7F7D5|nr:DUF2017 domain-containing protein [Georgenia sp. TF02-10]UNX54131.1 DUF2017 domain-containing protein [Georgenia sp. TF02-10]